MTTASTMGTTSDTAHAAYDELIKRIQEVGLLSGTARLMSWDQETKMPPGGANYRSRQMAQLARMVHEKRVDPRIGELLDICERDSELIADPLSDAAVNVREVRHSYDRATKLPTDLVEKFALVCSLAKAEWAQAREKSEFAIFAPRLKEIVALNREKAECYGRPDDVPADKFELWDALAASYEPGCCAADIADVFGALRPRLVTLIERLKTAPKPPSNAFNERKLPIEKQKAFTRFVAEKIGFDFNRGRLDESVHPFCSGTCADDVRMTARYHEAMLGDALGSVMHEAGHGMYGQGLPMEHVDTPRGTDVSLGIHESQSRMWENQVGRSQAFWQWCHPKLTEFFGNDAAGLSFDDVYRGINIVKPSLIRVEADEATYNLHVMVRFEIERAMISGDLSIDDLPATWNDLYKQYLGVDVPDDARGCLQDVHWSMGAIGYFPTYTLGNLYAAQFFDHAAQVLGDLPGQFARGEFDTLRHWLNENIHALGKRYRAGDLCQHLTGCPLDAEPLMNYLEAKLLPIYGIGNDE